MTKSKKTRSRTEFGDFQTPFSLAKSVTELLKRLGISSSAVLEPSCGKGAFLVAAAQSFPGATTLVGLDVNRSYIETALASLGSSRCRIHQGDFFTFDWPSVIKSVEGPWLILGNPPWVTTSLLSALESTNVPVKSNFHGRPGIEAVTGKSNFDISEWMLLKYLELLEDKGTIAVLCKTSVARKVLVQAWKHRKVTFSSIYKIDAMATFGVAVDACLLIISLGRSGSQSICNVFSSIEDVYPTETLSLVNGHLVAGQFISASLHALWGPEENYIWRSGIKHDCARVMELFPDGEHWKNRIGEQLTIEDEYLFPMLKGSDIGNGRTSPRGAMIVTQKSVGEDTHRISQGAPRTWAYLQSHSSDLHKRGSAIYKNKPPFSIFGVGPYTFAPWKVAVSSLYKKLLFVPVGPVSGRTVVFDDTVYFLPCSSEREARFLSELLHSDSARRFLESMVHWSDKRPLTIDLLRRLSIEKLSDQLGRRSEYEHFVGGKREQYCFPLSPSQQPDDLSFPLLA